MALDVLLQLFALTPNDPLPIVGTAPRQCERSNDTTRNDENKDDSHDKNQCTLKHVFILPYRTLSGESATRY